jgi:hypothetical protein
LWSGDCRVGQFSTTTWKSATRPPNPEAPQCRAPDETQAHDHARCQPDHCALLPCHHRRSDPLQIITKCRRLCRSNDQASCFGCAASNRPNELAARGF